MTLRAKPENNDLKDAERFKLLKMSLGTQSSSWF